MHKKKLKRELGKRGGPKEVTVPKTQQGRFLRLLWTRYGGINLAAEKAGFTAQNLNNWSIREKIPLEKCGIVARAFGIKIWALNYEECVLLLGDLAPSWAEAIKSFELSKEQLAYLHNGTPPLPKTHLLTLSPSLKRVQRRRAKKV